MENYKSKRGLNDRRPNTGRRDVKQDNTQNFEKAPNINVQKEFKPHWITSGIDESLIEFAERVGEYLVREKMTTSKIRNIYSEIKRVQSDFEKYKASFYLLKPKVAYAHRRDKSIGKFKEVFDECYKYINNKEHYENFCNIMEAIVAYHKAYGGN